MSVTLNQAEDIPAAYPDVPEGLSDAAGAINSDMIWQRIEAYISYRWTARQVVWIVEEYGDWIPILFPATISLIEYWNGLEWRETTLESSAYGGFQLPNDGPYRFTASVGAGTVPENVNEAFRRLAEYFAEDLRVPKGVSSYSFNLDGAVSEDYTLSPSWLAKAMQYSGAADLLRSYRKVN